MGTQSVLVSTPCTPVQTRGGITLGHTPNSRKKAVNYTPNCKGSQNIIPNAPIIKSTPVGSPLSKRQASLSSDRTRHCQKDTPCKESKAVKSLLRSFEKLDVDDRCSPEKITSKESFQNLQQSPLVQDDTDQISDLLKDLGFDKFSPRIARRSSSSKRGLKSSIDSPYSVSERSLKRNGQRSGLLTSPSQWSKKKTTYDRFVPNRESVAVVNSQVTLAMHMKANGDHTSSSLPTVSFTAELSADNTSLDNISQNYQLEVAKACGMALDQRIMSFNENSPRARNNKKTSKMVRPMRSTTTSVKRKIPTAPDKILDAPGLVDDFYRSLLDWSHTNVLAVALGSAIYLWDATQGSVTELCFIENTEITSISWSQDGCYVAVGDIEGKTQLWDVETATRVRTLHDPAARVGVLSWNSEILSTGSGSGSINNHDVRLPQSRINTLQGHRGEVCGLQWSFDGSLLGSGGNDNLVNIWDIRNTQPLFTKREHSAAVKALAWCPWQSNLLATGGGQADEKIHFWRASTGVKDATIDAGSQVTSVVWSKSYRELVSAHGNSDNQLVIWKYPSLTKVMELPNAHESRILHTAISPDGQTVCSAGGDENLKFWRLFATDKRMMKKKTSGAKSSTKDNTNISPDLASEFVR